MKRIYLAAVMALAPFAAGAQVATGSSVVADCGTLSYTVGAVRSVDQDAVGRACVDFGVITPVAGFEQITPSTATALTVPATAKIAVITIEGQTVRWRDDGTSPTASVGFLLAVGSTMTYKPSSLALIKFIQTTATATVSVAYYK